MVGGIVGGWLGDGMGLDGDGQGMVWEWSGDGGGMGWDSRGMGWDSYGWYGMVMG